MSMVPWGDRYPIDIQVLVSVEEERRATNGDVRAHQILKCIVCIMYSKGSLGPSLAPFVGSCVGGLVGSFLGPFVGSRHSSPCRSSPSRSRCPSYEESRRSSLSSSSPSSGEQSPSRARCPSSEESRRSLPLIFIKGLDGKVWHLKPTACTICTKRNWVKNSEEQAAKFAKGEGAFQLAAMTEVKKLGFECDDATKAQSIFHSVKCAKEEGNFQLAVKTELKKRGIECDESTKAQCILQFVKCAKGEGNFQLAAKTELKKRGIECDESTKAQSILYSINYPMWNPATAAKKQQHR